MLPFLKSLAKRYGTDEISTKAAALAYFTIFSIGPLLFIIFGVIGEILKSKEYRDKLLEEMQSMIGPEAGSLISGVLENQTLSDSTGVAFLIGAVGLILGALGIFGQLQKSLDNILGVKVGPGAGLERLIRQRLISLGLVGVIAFLLLVSLVASTVAAELVSRVNQEAVAGIMVGLLDFLVSLLVFTVLLALLYRTLPEVRLPWRLLFSVSALVALFFSAGKTILGLIIGGNDSITAFGAAGSLIALLLWVFYSGQVIYLGASGISLYAERHNIKMEPKYPGKRGVLRIREVEEPLDASISKKVKRKFVKGIKKGWKQ